MPVRLSLPKRDAPYGVSIIKQNSVQETYPTHCHDFYEIFFISGGKGVHCVGEQRLLLEKGSLVLIRPDDVHSFQAFSSFDFSMYSLGFSMQEMHGAMDYMSFARELAQKPELPPAMVLHGHERAYFEQELEKLLQSRPQQRLQQFRSLLPGILHRLLDPPADENVAPEVFPRWLSQLDDAMSLRENYIQGLPRLQALCPYTQAYTNRVFKRYMKITPTEYINNKRMRYASELLLENRHEVTEICYMVGFNNLSHFYAVFRGIYHCTPKEFVERQGYEEDIRRLRE